MGSKFGFFGICGVLCLGCLALVCQIIIPDGRKTLADLSDIYTPKNAGAQVAGEAHAAVTDDADEEELETSRSASERLEALERNEDELLLNGRDLAHQNLRGEREVESAVGQERESQSAQFDQLLEAKQNLEAQQETLIREIVSLKKQLRAANERAERSREASDDSSSQERSQLEQTIRTQSERAEKQHTNLKLLAEHIMELRQDLKDRSAEVSLKETEITTLQEQLSSEQRMNATKEDEKVALTQERKKVEQERDELITRLEEAHKKIEEQEQSIGGLRANFQQSDTEKQSTAELLTRAKEDLRGQNEELDSTQRQLSKTIEEARVCGEALLAKSKTADQIPQVEKNLADARAALAEKDKEIVEYKKQVQDRDQLVSNLALLKKELLAAKNQLLLKEKAAQILGSGKKPAADVSPEVQAERDRILMQSGRDAGLESMRSKSAAPPASDVMVVEVIGSHVALRTGPSPDDSELMSVGKGTRLTVEERSGEWYRVIAPNSVRAYVRADLVRIFSGGRPDAGEAPVRRPGLNRAPKKRALKAVEEDPNMEAFGDVRSAVQGDHTDRAVERMRQQLGSEGAKPEVPGLMP